MSTKSTGERIIELRDAKGLNQDQLCERIGISRPTLSDLENNEGKAVQIMRNLASALNTTVAYLIGEINDPSPDALKEFDKKIQDAETASFFKERQKEFEQ